MIRDTFQKVTASLSNPTTMGRIRVALAIGFFIILNDMKVAAMLTIMRSMSVRTHRFCCIRPNAIGFASMTYPLLNAMLVER